MSESCTTCGATEFSGTAPTPSVAAPRRFRTVRCGARCSAWQSALTRSPPPGSGPARSTSYWTGFNAASELVCRRHPGTSIRLRYENFARDPRGSVADILRLLGLDAELPIDTDGTATLGVNHTVTGNPDRFAQGRVR